MKLRGIALPLLALVPLAACGGSKPAAAPSPPASSPTSAAPSPRAADGLFHGPDFTAQFPNKPKHLVQHSGSLTVDIWGVAAGGLNRSVLRMAPLPLVKGREKVQLANAVKRYWATYHANVLVDPVPIRISGRTGVSFTSGGDGQLAQGVAVARGKTAYLVFYLAEKAQFNVDDALAFGDSFKLD
jgi:hypothetical protein